MNLLVIQKENKNICIMIPYGKNRTLENIEWAQKVYEKYNVAVNFIEFPFPSISHGQALDFFIGETQNTIDYYVFLETDSIPLDKDFLNIAVDKIKDGKTLFSVCQTANHKDKSHIYGGPSFLAFSKELWIKLGRPSLNDHFSDCDTAQNLTREVEKQGYNLCLIYPMSYGELSEESRAKSGNPKHWELGGRLKYGFGTNFGGLIYHQMMQSEGESSVKFIEKCKEILKERKLEAIVVCVGYSKFLEITLPLNKKHFDNVIIVTTPNDLETKRVCDENSVKFVETNRFYENGAIFDKGGSINEGILKLNYGSFVCHLDCDIVLPDNFRDELKLENLDSNILYGCRRFFIDKYRDWLDYKEGKKEKEDFDGLQLGGFGCGYIQIWDMQSPKIKGISAPHLYPSYKTAGESDILMLKQFHPDVASVGKLNIDVAHLGNFGVNHDTKDDKGFFS
jgi:hypothetical protein